LLLAAARFHSLASRSRWSDARSWKGENLTMALPFFPFPSGRFSRRSFVLGAGLGLAAGLPLGWLGWHAWQLLQDEKEPFSPFRGRCREVAQPEYALPGRFPGRVIEVRSPAAVSPRYEVRRDVVRRMLARGLCELTGADDAVAAWRSFVQRGEVIGIKVNPVGRAPRPGEAGRLPAARGCISSPALLLEVVAGLKRAGVRPQDILVFERYAREFREAGYEELLREPDMEGVRWCASSVAYSDQQVALDGHDEQAERDPKVVGYDRDVYVSLGFAGPQHDPHDDRRFRSHLSLVATCLVDKIINLPCLKDHRSAGVTLALKNLSHGLNNNVARSHLGMVYGLAGLASGPNQCNSFIPTAVAQEPLRRKVVLHILDGLIGVYEGGPGCWNPTWRTWRRQSLFLATDPVALDLVGWYIIDTKRIIEGWLPVASQGVQAGQPGVTLSPRLLALAGLSPESAALALGEHLRQHPPGQHQEQFDRRQPEHIFLAGLLGLGVCDPRQIEHRTCWVA
jgi:uncharacterized protein (DUF362 family)